jgi:hypothetical protein
VFTICNSKKLLLSVLFALLLVCPVVCFADYIMSDKERAESLQIIADLKRDLVSRQAEYEGLKQVNTQIEEQLVTSTQKIKELEIKNSAQTLSIQELKLEQEKIQEDLNDLRKSLMECKRQNKRLKIERWLFLVAGILTGKLL